MKTYDISAVVTISVHTRVRAGSVEEALALAADRPLAGLCAQCGGDRGRNEEWCTAGELDGEPQMLTATEVRDAR